MTFVPLPVLAFQVLDVAGILGQAVFSWRVVDQWMASERAKRTVIPASFWAWSLLGSCLLIVYVAHRRDPAFMLSALVNACIHARNLWLSRPGVPARRVETPALWPVILGLALFAGITIEAIGPDHGLIRFDTKLAWLVVGFIGQALWSGRAVYQWYVSERKGESVLPPSYFWCGILGAVFSFAYAVFRVDWVQMFAYGLSPIPYARNLLLQARHEALLREQAAAASAPSVEAPPASGSEVAP